MRNPFRIGTTKILETIVSGDKLAEFETGQVHPVYSTFALGKDVEWACRQFVLEMKEIGEEGVGTHLSIDHLFPAPQGSKVAIHATLEEVAKNNVHCSFQAFSNGRLIASGKQSQKIIQKASFEKLINEIQII